MRLHQLSHVKLFKITLAVCCQLLFAQATVNAQATCVSPTNISGFGVDGDVRANTPAAVLGDSWFYSSSNSGPGIGIIGTTAATATPALSSSQFGSLIQNATTSNGRNRTYVQRMSVSALTVVNGNTMIDAFAGRDNISPDSTAFSGSNKNGDNPGNWSIGNASVPNKNDIIDVGGHLRRNNTTNKLWMFTFMTKLSTGGDSYSDIEIYRTVPYINASTGKLVNTGPASTGGHTAFLFGSNASIQTPGDIILCMNFSGTSGVASIRVWCNINNLDGNNNGVSWFNALPARPFNFTGDFITGTGSNGYGYAEITSLSGAPCLMYSVQNSGSTPAGDWGNLTSSSATFDSYIETGQLVNIAFNFTDIGLDFATLNGPCTNVFGALLFKTRSSSSYSAELKDCVGPFTFANFSEIQAYAGVDKSLNCNINQVTLSGSSATSGATLSWSTPNGNIVSGANTATPVVNEPGIYILSAQSPLLSSCIAKDTVIVTQNLTGTNVSAGSNKVLTCSTTSVALDGYSPTLGATFYWQALNGGNIVSGSNTATPVVNAAGCYVVTATNNSTGCSSLDTVCVTLNYAVPVISAPTQSNVSCFAACNGSASFNVGGTNAPFTYQWSNGASTQAISGVCAGTYSVIVTGANGCTSSSTFNLSQPNATLASAANTIQNVNCNGGTNGSISASGNGGTTPYSYLWNTGSTSQVLSNVGTGSFTVTVTDANGCTSQSSATITQPSEALATTSNIGQQVSCFGGNNGSVNLTVSGGTAPYNYLWSNGQTTKDLSGLSSGSYTVTVNDANGCVTTRTITITQPSAVLSSSASQSQAVSCYAGNNGQMSLSVNGGTSPYSYSWNTGATTQAINGLSAGTYTVTVSDANGCTTISSASILQPSVALSGSTTTTSNISCFSGNNGSINLSVNGGTSPYTYMWNTGTTTQDLAGLPAGSYSVTITDFNGCTAQATGTITQPVGTLSANLNVSQNVACYGGGNGAFNLTVTGGTAPYSYSWSNGATSEDINGLPLGTYTVSITDANGCISSATGSITQPSAALGANINNVQNVGCFGGNDGSLNITVNGGTSPYSYNWSNGSVSQDINNLSSGTYTVTITDANGCTYVQSGIVGQPTVALSAGIGVVSNVLCYSGNTGSVQLSVNGGTSPYTYNWSNGAISQNINGLTSGIYSVNVTDANGCNTSASVSISQPAATLNLSTVMNQSVACFGGNTGSASSTVTGGTAPYTYSWNSGAVTSTINALTTGSYTLTVTDANGCSSMSIVNITQPSAALSSSATPSLQVNCFGGNNGAANLTVSGGTAPYIYNWSNGTTTQDLSNLSAGIYTVTVTDARGCTSLSTVNITQPSAAISVSALPSQNVSCFGGNNGSVTLTAGGGTAPYLYSWSNGSSTQNLNGLSAGVYSVTVTDANGCVANALATVSQPIAELSLLIDVSQNVSCFGFNNGSTGINVTGGTTPYTYIWSNGSISQNIINLVSGTYTVTVTDANGCNESLQASISQPSASLSATVSPTQQVSCFGGNTGAASLSVSGGTAPYSYDWNNGATTPNINSLSAGVYSVTITDINNCIANQTVTITQPTAALSATSNLDQQVSCFGGNNGQIVLTANGGTSPYSYNWSNGQTTQNISNLSSGSYTVTVTDANGCTTNQSATVTQPAAALSGSTAVTSNISCFSGNNGSIDLTVAGGTGPFTFTWSTGALTEDLTGLSAGLYSVTITDANGCSAQSSGTITQPVGALSTNINISQNIPCFGGGSGAIDLSVSGGTMPYNYNWSNGANTQDISNLAAGVYTVTITDNNGCNTISTATITQPSAPLSSSVSANQSVLCFAGTNGSLEISATGGTFPYTYSWNNGETSPLIFNLSSGTYTVTITDANGCTTIQSATITQPAAPLSPTAAVLQQVLCFGGNNASVDLSVAGGTAPYTYSWNNGQTTQDLSGLTSGTYTVTVTDANGCISSQSATVTQPSASLSAGASSTQQVFCFGGNNGTATVSVSGGTAPYTYNWSNGSNTQNITGLLSGTYTVTVTDANGCSQNSSALITQPSAALSSSANVSQAVSCFGGNNGSIVVSINGGTTPYTYNWSNGATTQNISGLVTGTYTVTVTDANGCSSIQSRTVTQPAASLSGNLTVSQNVSCFGGNNGTLLLAVNGGTSPYTYNWNNGATTQNISGVASGNYTVTITDANGCTNIQTSSVTQPAAALSASAGVNQNVSCYGGNNGSINLVVSGGTMPYSYNWSNGASTQNISGLTAGIYSVIVTDANGCTGIQIASIAQPAAQLNSTLTAAQNVLCFGGNTGVINLSVSGGTAPYSYQWNTGSTLQNPGNLSAGNYSVTITDANNCTNSGTVTISQPAAVLNGNTSVTQNVFCFGGNNGALNLTVNGGTAPYTFNWSNGATSQNLSGVTSGIYNVTVTDANGCIFNSSATVTQPAASLSSSTTVGQNINCFGGNNGIVNALVSGGTAPYSFIWSNGSTTQLLTGIPAGVYTVTVSDINGCTATSSASIIQPNAALATGSNVNQNVSCFGGSNGVAEVNASGGTAPYSYSWNNGATTQILTGVSSGTYTVTVTDGNGCTSTQTLTISQPAASLSGNINITQQVNCFGGANGSIDLSVSGGTMPYTYVWSNGATNQDLTGMAAGTYSVTIADINGCTSVQSVTITQPAAGLTPSISSTQNVNCFSGNNGSISINVNGGTAPYSYFWSNGQTSQNVNGLSSGTFTVTVTDANGCIATQNASITQPSAALNSSVSVGQNVNCFGGNNGSVNLNVNGGTSPYSYTWSSGQSTQNISGLATGIYTVTVTDANGCTTNQSATVTQPSAALSATANSSQQVSCFGGNNGQIVLATNGGTSPYSYTWSNGQTTQNISNLISGSYTVTVTDANGCTTIQSATVTQPTAALSGNTTVTSNISCFSGNNGTIDLTVAGGTGPFTFTWSTGATTEDLTGLSAGLYSVTITDANGCSAQSSGTIMQPIGALSTNINISQNIPCFGGGSGAIDLSVSGGTMPYNYNWSNGANTQDISNLAAGVYTVTITDVNGCNTMGTATITQPSAPLSSSVSANQPVLCFGGTNGSLEVSAAGGTFPYTYAWNNGEITPIIFNLSSGTYTVTITDANGCTTVQSATITQPAAALSPTATVLQQVLCFGGNNASVDLSVTGGTAPYSYNWSNGQISQDLTGLTSGTYTVTVTDANGCISTQNATVTQPAASLSAGASSTQQVFCFGGSNGTATVLVSGGTAPYVYSWSNGAITQNVTGLSSGTYTVTVTDANGCSQNSSATVTQPSAALSSSANVSQNVSCYAGNNGSIVVSVNGGTSPYTYNWSNGATTQNISGLATGTYTVTVTDANGCPNIIDETVTQPTAALNASAVVSANVLCFAGNNGSIDLTVNGGTSPYIFNWNNGAITQNLSGLIAGNYSVTITDANGCTTTQSATITQPQATIVAGASATQQVSCFGGNNGAVNVSVAGGTTPYTYNWSNGEITQDITGLSSGTYTVTVTDANGCSSTSAATVSQPSASLSANAIVDQNVLCFGGNNGSISISINGGTAPYIYNWNNGATSQNINGLVSGTYTVTVTDFNGCTFVISETVSQPNASLSSTAVTSANVLCFAGNNGSIDLSVSGGTAPYIYLWNNGSVNEDQFSLQSGWYYVTITDINGCITSDSAEVTQPVAALSSAITSSQNVLCFGGNTGSVDLSVSGGTAPYGYSWNTGATTEDISGLTTGIYTVIITDSNGCSETNSIFIGEPAAPLSASLLASGNVFCNGGNNGFANLNVTGGTAPYIYLWSNGETNEDISNLTAGTYIVTVTDSNGCIENLSVSISEPVAALAATLTVTQQVNCFAGEDGAIDLNAIGGTAPYTYQWSNGETTEDISQLFAGPYTVTITDANGCIFTDQINVFQPGAPLLSNVSVVSNVFCNGGSTGSLDLTVNGGTSPYTFIWSNGAITEDINNLSTGVYTVIVTDANGCSSTASSGIGQPSQQLSATAVIQNVLCFNGNNGFINISAAGGTTPYMFIWSNGATTEDIGGLITGTYTVTISDANGCDTSIVSQVIQPQAPLIPSLAVGQHVSCFGGSDGNFTLGVTGGTPPYVFLWSNGATTQNNAALPAGTYTVTITDGNGCNAIITEVITQPLAPLAANLDVNQHVSCYGGNDATVTANVSGGTAPYSYQWSTGANTQSINNLVAGTYTITVTDIKGCTYTSSVVITQPAAPLSQSGITTIADCLYGLGGSATVTASGGTAPYTYLWSNGSVTPLIIDVPPATYTVTVTDANGCSNIGNYVVGNESDLVMQTGPTIICVGEFTTLSVDSISGATYQWYFTGAPLNGATSHQFTTPAAGFYYVSVTTSCGTFSTDSVEIIVKSVENATISNNQIICPPEMVQLHVTGGVTYLWTPGTFISSTASPDPIVAPQITTTYTVEITNEWGCKAWLDVDVAVACDTLLVPTGFSPNDDGTNDGYVINHIDNYPGNKLWVYNRWGNLIYKAKDYDNSWDGVSNVSGIYMGKKVPTGTYFYILDLNDNSKPRAGYLIIRR